VATVDGPALRVLSYNVHGLRDDRAALIGLVRGVDPDVMIVQEAPRRFRWREKTARLAGDFGLVVAAGGLPALGNLLLTSLRVHVHETSCLRYPLTPGRHLRGAAFATCSVGSTRFTVSGSHLATDATERPDQAARWKAALAAVEGPLIAGVDLNEGPGGGAWRTVADGLLDAAGSGAGALRRTFPATVPRHRLDALFVSPDVRVTRYEVIETDQARRASDHLPILAELVLPQV
jgi:endonuclease/exonuclease/phosphatase family metal-dependent hydrolase